jgi:hypothetical protein
MAALRGMGEGFVMGVDEMRRSRVACVSDDGLVVLSLPDGKRRVVTIPRESVSLVRRLAAIDRDRDQAIRDS